MSGRLYAIVAGGGTGSSTDNRYENISLTTSGPSVTKTTQFFTVAYKSMISAIGVFTGTGATINVTATLNTAVGSPTSPIIGLGVIEVLGASGTDRAIGFSADTGSSSSLYTITRSLDPNTVVTGNRVLAGIAINSFAAPTSLEPNAGETELFELQRSHASGTGYGYGTGLTMRLQAQHSGNASASWAIVGDEYEESMVLTEFVLAVAVGSTSTPVVFITGRYTPGVVGSRRT